MSRRMALKCVLAATVLCMALAGPLGAAGDVAPDGVVYVVKEGDTLEALAKTYLGGEAGGAKIVEATLAAQGDPALADAEALKAALRPGQKLIIPVKLTAREADSFLLVDKLQFPEGVRIFPNDDAVYFVEWEGDNVWKYQDGQKTLFIKTADGDGPNGLARDADGNFWVVFYSSGKLAQYSPEGKQLKVYAEGPEGRFIGPNDLVIDQAGGVFFTDSGDFDEDWTTGREAGKVYYLTPGGEVRLIDKNISYANGLAISPSGGRLYVNEHRKNQILVYDLAGDQATNRRVLVKLPEDCLSAGESCFEVGPDGMNIDKAGNLWVAHYHAGEILKISPDGRIAGRVYLPRGDTPTNVALSPDEKTLYITESSQGLLLKVPVE